MLPISVCIIAKNESLKIDRCLSSLIPYGFEIVVIDTGSADNTKELAHKYTNHIYDFDWIEDFSAARNYSLDMASNDWIFMIDCDEYILDMDVEELFYFMDQLPHAVGSISRRNVSAADDDSDYYTDNTERFFNKKLYFYTGIIHEQLTPRYQDNFEAFLLNTTLYHDGYAMTQEERRIKSDRNISLLLKQLEKESDNPYVYYQLGKGYEIIEVYDSAYYYYSKGLTFTLDYSLAYVQALVISYGKCLLHLGKYTEALEITNLYESLSASADYLYLCGLIYMNNELYDEALREFKKALTVEYSNENGTNSFLSRYQIAIILLRTGSVDIAKQYLSKCSDYAPALNMLKKWEDT